MIIYRSEGIHQILNIFRLKGSIYVAACLAAIPNAIVTGIMRNYLPLWAMTAEEGGRFAWVVVNSTLWAGFSSLLGFLVVFRTSQGYARFWSGCTSLHRMKAQWFDACSATVAFGKFAKQDTETVTQFANLMVRLFSMLYTLALAEIEDADGNNASARAFDYELVGALDLDTKTIRAVKDSDSKVELVYQWIQQAIVGNISQMEDPKVLNIPPPILSRVFQQLGGGMAAFHDAVQVSSIPFPFPYAQCCSCLLAIHWLLTPWVVCGWSTAWPIASGFSFLQVFILWALNSIAIEIENPFGTDSNDLDGLALQTQMNRNLEILLEASTQATPYLRTEAEKIKEARELAKRGITTRRALGAMWQCVLDPVDPNALEDEGCTPVSSSFSDSSKGSCQSGHVTEDTHDSLRLEDGRNLTLGEDMAPSFRRRTVRNQLLHASSRMSFFASVQAGLRSNVGARASQLDANPALNSRGIRFYGSSDAHSPTSMLRAMRPFWGSGWPGASPENSELTHKPAMRTATTRQSPYSGNAGPDVLGTCAEQDKLSTASPMQSAGSAVSALVLPSAGVGNVAQGTAPMNGVSCNLERQEVSAIAAGPASGRAVKRAGSKGSSSADSAALPGTATSAGCELVEDERGVSRGAGTLPHNKLLQVFDGAAIAGGKVFAYSEGKQVHMEEASITDASPELFVTAGNVVLLVAESDKGSHAAREDAQSGTIDLDNSLSLREAGGRDVLASGAFGERDPDNAL